MRWIVFVLFGVLVSGCSSKYDLGEMIAEAVAAGESGIVIPDGYHVIDEAIVMDGVTNFNISGDTLGRSVITSGMRLSLDDFECVDEAKGIYEISLPELQMEAWPDAFRGYAGWPELSVNGEPLILARYPNTGYLTIDSLISQCSIPRNEDTTAFGGAFISNEMAAVLTAGAEIYLGGYWCYKWYDEFMRVESVDATTESINWLFSIKQENTFTTARRVQSVSSCLRA